MQTQIFPLPDHPLQYRAIGLIQGKYKPSQQRFSKGTLLTSDGTAIDTVLLGRLVSLAQKYLDLEQEQWWVVYPRTRVKAPRLHVQIQGVRSPRSQNSNFVVKPTSSRLVNEPDTFSIRGKVIDQDAQMGHVIVKIHQSSRKSPNKTKTFKLKLWGFLPPRAVEWFWDLQVRREGEYLVIQDGQQIAHTLAQKPTHKKHQKIKN